MRVFYAAFEIQQMFVSAFPVLSDILWGHSNKHDKHDTFMDLHSNAGRTGIKEKVTQTK